MTKSHQCIQLQQRYLIVQTRPWRAAKDKYNFHARGYDHCVKIKTTQI